MNPSITTCPASVPVIVLLWPLAKKRDGKQRAGSRRAEQRRKGQIGDSNPVGCCLDRRVPSGNALAP